MNKTSILVIEDDPAILQGLKDLLQLENYEVSISSDGEQGTGMAIQNQPDLILLDINLPSLNGFEVCRKLRENSYINPIIMLTARGESIDRVVGLELGANDYITKPFNSHELLARIHSNLRSTERLTRKIRKPFTGERKLLAVMFTDMKDYALKMNTNEKLALKLLEIHNQLVKEIVETNHGKIVEIIGDAFVVTFESAVKAVVCAYEIQKKLNKYNNSEAPDHQIEIRIGIHAGDVIEFENNIKGDTVNIAARIQQAAKPGSIFLSRNVYDIVKSKVKLNFHFLGKFKFKNIVEPVKLYKINL